MRDINRLWSVALRLLLETYDLRAVKDEDIGVLPAHLTATSELRTAVLPQQGYIPNV